MKLTQRSMFALVVAAAAVVGMACAPGEQSAAPAAEAAAPEVATPAATAPAEAAPAAQPASLKLAVTGMTCAGCESSIKEAVGAIPGVTTVNASHTEGSAQVEYDAAQVNPEAIRTAIEKLGYGIAPEPAPAAEQAAPTQS